MIYTTEVPHLNSGIRSAVTLGKFDGFHRGHQNWWNVLNKSPVKTVVP